MAQAKNQTANDHEDDGWETIQERSASVVIFDTVGDELIGTYRGIETIEPDDDPDNAFSRYLLEGTDGELYATNISYALRSAVEKHDVKVGDMLRIRYVGDVKTKRGLNPMKDFEIAVKRHA